MSSIQRHLRFLHPSAMKPTEWIRQAAITVNGILSGGPFPYLWRDNIMALSNARLGAAVNQPTWATFIGGTGAFEFSPSAINEVFTAFHIDHDYARGTKIYPHFHWSADTVNTGVARWGFEYTIARGHQQEVFPATTTVYIEQAFTGTAFTHMIGEVSDADAIDGDALNLEPDTIVNMRVFRDAAHANDTLTSTAFGLFADLHYQASMRGTRNKAPNFYV